MSNLSDEIQEIASLRPGGIYLFRAPHQFRLRQDMEEAQEYLNGIAGKTGCTFVLLHQDFELVKPMSDFVIPARGSRKDAIAISYDVEDDWLSIDGVKVSPDLLLDMFTKPDPRKTLCFERKGDTVMCRQEIIVEVK